MEQYLDKIVKAPPGVKFGGLAAAVVAMTAINFFLFITPVEDRIKAQLNERRTLDNQLAEKS